MNNKFEDPYLINVALSHMQFEIIHAYKDGNGRLGRALIPVQMTLLDDSQPIIYIYIYIYQKFLRYINLPIKET